MPVTHIVAFKLKPSADPAEICTAFSALKTSCTRINSGVASPYILSIKGGKNNSTEGLTKGYTHAFVVEFASVNDRDFYVNGDLKHKAFGERLVNACEDGVDGVIVVDFEH